MFKKISDMSLEEFKSHLSVGTILYREKEDDQADYIVKECYDANSETEKIAKIYCHQGVSYGSHSKKIYGFLYLKIAEDDESLLKAL